MAADQLTCYQEPVLVHLKEMPVPGSAPIQTTVGLEVDLNDPLEVSLRGLRVGPGADHLGRERHGDFGLEVWLHSDGEAVRAVGGLEGDKRLCKSMDRRLR